MKFKKSQRNNIIFLAIIILMLIPQIRHPFQVFLHKGIALFSPSVETGKVENIVTFSSWKLQDELGEIIDFKDLKGKVVFLNFWATWCPPCIAELPSIQALYDAYHDKIEFVIVSNENREVIDNFLERKGYNLQTLVPLSGPTKEFNISSIPRTFLIDMDGNIVVDESRAANWNSDAIRTLIDSLLP